MQHARRPNEPAMLLLCPLMLLLQQAAAAAAAASSAITGWDIGIRRMHCKELFYPKTKFLAYKHLK